MAAVQPPRLTRFYRHRERSAANKTIGIAIVLHIPAANISVK
jgi:hypothetical protein